MLNDQTGAAAPVAAFIPSGDGGQPQAFAGTGGPTVGFAPVRLGSEILVNTATADGQTVGSLTTLSDGGFVITWEDLSLGVGGAGGDASQYAVKAQVFTAAGVPVGTEIRVNTATAESQAGPQITALDNGGFVITWNDYSEGVGGAGGDTSGYAVKAQVFTAAGVPVGTEIRVNTATDGFQGGAKITALDNGGFVITWTDFSYGVGGAAGDTTGLAVKAQVFTAAGVPVGTEILVNTATASHQETQQITALDNGGFVITWQDLSLGVGGAGGDTSSYAIKVQLFTAAGTPVGTEIRVNTATASAQEAQQITALDNGGFVITWQDLSLGAGGAGGDASQYAVKAQVFTAAGVPAGTEIRVNTATANSQNLPQITALDNGGFVITWQDLSLGIGGAGGDTTGTAVKAQVFTAAGVPVGTEILVNTATAGNQEQAVISALSDGGFVITWQDGSRGVGGAAGDTSSLAVKAQVFTAAGVRVGAEILVNTATGGIQAGQQITALDNGGFVITWLDYSQGFGGAGGDASGYAVKAQVYSSGVSAVEQVARDLKNSGFTITDPDAADVLTVTLSAGYGLLTVTAGTSGAQVTGSGTNSVTITGTAAQIAALLNTDPTSVVSYLADTDTPPASTMITFSADDGAGGTSSVNIITLIQDLAEPVGPTAAADALTGTAGDDTIDGLAGDDTLEGGDGDDYLKGGDGDDILRGGTGNDTYVVDSTGDTTDETGGDGIDLVISRVSWTLGAGIENLTLGSAGGSTNGTGNSLDNVITGNAGANTLSGLAGEDTLIGGGGHDVLLGGADDDILDGGAGNDRLDGGSGDDAMTGGAGNDVYVLDSAGDTVIELPSGGTDTIESSLASTNLQNYANVENLTLLAGANMGQGNDNANVITGNSGSNGLFGWGGNDTLIGGDGGDILFGGQGADVLYGGAGVDIFSYSNPGEVNGDRIMDLNFAEGDVMSLNGLDANVNEPYQQSFHFVDRFTKTAGEATLTYNAVQNLTYLRLDTNGDGIYDEQLMIVGDFTGTKGNRYEAGGYEDGGWLM